MRRIFFSLSILLLAAACSAPKTPVIGISCSRSASGAAQLASAYTEAVQRAGGIAVVLPTLSDAAQAEALLRVLDGLILSGGEAAQPGWYGEEVWNETVYIDSLRDRSDSLLARAAIASGKPVLAICRGEQLMNVILGGSLYQDLPSQFDTTVTHGGGTEHRIGLEPGSVLAELYGPDSLTVNSFHHQAVKDPAPGINITARSRDGLPEAWETGRIWAVQFHPEKMLQQGDSRWLSLFDAFVRRCGTKSARPRT